MARFLMQTIKRHSLHFVLAVAVALAGMVGLSAPSQAQKHSSSSYSRPDKPKRPGPGRGGVAIGVGAAIGIGLLISAAAKAEREKKRKKKKVYKKPPKKKYIHKAKKRVQKKRVKKVVRRAPRVVAPPPIPQFRDNELLLAFSATTPLAQVDSLLAQYGLTRLGSEVIGIINRRLVRVSGSDNLTTAQTLQLSNIPGVLGVQPNYLFMLTKSKKSSRRAGLQYAVRTLQVRDVHKFGRGQGVAIAVIDSGLNHKHPAFRNANIESHDVLSDLDKGHKLDDSHGTAVTSILTAQAGLTGIAPEAKIYSVRAFALEKKTGRAFGSSYDLLRAIDWATYRAPHVLNMSFAGPDDPLLHEALQMAAKRNIILVAAAGNRGPKAAPVYPAAYEEVIAATATDVKNRLYKNANRGEYVAIAAPGVDILVAKKSKSYGTMTGTSMAAAYVTGGIALMVEKNPDLTVNTIMQYLAQYAKDLGTNGKDPKYGYGLMRIYDAVASNQGNQFAQQKKQ